MAGKLNSFGQLFEGAKITPGVRKAAQRALDYGKLRIAARTPVATGFLKSQWQLKLEGYGVRIQNEADYALYVDQGTKRMAARPMVAPTVSDMQVVFAKEVAKEVGRALGAKIVGNVSGVVGRDQLQNGTSNALPGLGFKGTGADPATLTNKQKTQYNKKLGKAFPAFPGKLQSAKADRVGAR